MEKKKISTQSLVIMAMFAAVLAVSAYLSIPLPFPGAPHITMQNFMIILIALLFPIEQSVMIVAVWMLLGICGVPVFIGGKAGLAYLLQPWGGYTIVYILTAALIPLIKGKSYNRIRYTLSAVFGAIFIDIIGMLYLHFYPGSGYENWTLAITAGFLAFIPLDMCKCVVAAQIVPAFTRVMKMNDNIRESKSQTVN
ncbi:biotin transport system substrate-specific component [Acetitomaculum ruminis DSM 5522]|uniref:Biotin transporter n=1 Tax=Acetitomaculum ruminis DSM 5522 TaxID=1120918 RepID=A0A1I0XY36_9FIRM|nr:biotin transporter BioY [Acetitomaculum ruminis]SFB05935.1 biotin transport system substrate-specific component [Acetitomaculum ruminis DSM 5522]